MLNTIRLAIARAIAPKVAPAPKPAATKKGGRRARLQIVEALQAMAKVAADNDPRIRAIPYSKIQAPSLPPGVLPKDADTLAMDTVCTGEVKRSGITYDSGGSTGPAWDWLTGGSFGAGLFFPGYPYLSELAQISEYRAPAETISTEMTRKWFELQSKDGGDKSDTIAQIMAKCDELKVREKFRRAALLDGLFGLSHIYLNINDANDKDRQLPLDLSMDGMAESIPKGSLKSIQCIEPYWVTPYSWNADRPEREDFYKPTSWYIMGRKTHSTRMLSFVGREVPDLLKPAYNFGGISLTQLEIPYVQSWLRTRNSVGTLISNFSVPVLHTNLNATLEDGEEGTGLLPRLQEFTLTRNNQAVAAIQKDEELLEFAEASLASLDKLQAQSQEHMSAPNHIPLVKLFGVTPTGLNATGEGEIQVWYDWVNAYQINLFQPHLEILLRAIQCDLFGKIDPDLVIHWITLDEPTQKELSEIRKSDADAGSAYINGGVITADEERARLQSDPDSGYSNLTGPAPEPEEPEMPEEDPEGAAAREHQSSEADKDRDHDLLKTGISAAAAAKKPAVPIKAKTSG
jgi:uncharacterized protein